MFLLLILDLISFFFHFDFLRYSKVQLVSYVWFFFGCFLGTHGDFCFFFSGSTVSTLYGTLWAQLNVM